MTPPNVYGIAYWKAENGRRRFPTLDDAIRLSQTMGRSRLALKAYNRYGKVVTSVEVNVVREAA